MTGRPGRVCVVGSLNVDTTYHVQRIPVVGETILAHARSVAPGGKGANQAVASATMGSQVAMIGCVGADPEAAVVRTALIDRGVNVAMLMKASDAPTGTAIVLVDEQGENVIAVYPGANQHVDPGAVAAHLGSSPYDVVISQLEINLPAVLSAARSKRSATFVLNPAPMTPDVEILQEILAHTDVFVPNRVELSRLAGRPVPVTRDELDACVEAIGYEGVVIVTLGSDGAALYEQGRRQPATYLDGVPVRSVDTTGAGDTFCGVLAHGLATHGDMTRAVREANDVAARSTTVQGAQIPAALVRA
ncbi:MAG: ribokinase [Chloroflexi bacterium]|nr:ribokinase [Chloroflexota bacterium]